MCTRFRTVPVNVTDSSNDAGFEGADRYVGLMPGGTPTGTTSSVHSWHLADIAVELADVSVRAQTDEPPVSVLTLGVETL
jgi:hypothetical protein